MTSPEMLKS